MSTSFVGADIIFASSTCYEAAYIDYINSQVKDMKDGSYLIMLTKQLKNDQLECVYKGFQKMGWGTPTVYIYKKI